MTKELEQLRIAGKIGSPLQAHVEVRAAGERYAALTHLKDDLRFVLITSQAQAVEAREETVIGVPSPHPKCERCWHYRADVGADAERPGLCGRCRSNLFGAGEPREFA